MEIVVSCSSHIECEFLAGFTQKSLPVLLQLDCSVPGAAAAGMRIRLRGPGHAASLLAELNRCRRSRRFCDVFLQVGNRTFAAHRAVLACAGTYFHSLFSRSVAPPSAAFSLEFISPANFEKVLTFVYTGEILTDLIDVGVLYELAERLGVTELVRACHATFPDLQTSANSKSSSSGDLSLDSSLVPSVVSTAAAPSASCSSATSCSSLSSSAAPTPAAAPSPLFQTGTARTDAEAQSGAPPLTVKAEDVQSNVSYGQMDHQPPGGHGLLTNTQRDGVLPAGPVLPAGLGLQLKSERGLDETGGCCEDADRGLVSAIGPSDSSLFPDSSAPLEACNPTSSSGEPVGNQLAVQMEQVQRDDRLMFEEVEVTEEEQWRQLAVDIIELSDDENFMEDGDEEEDEDDLVCLENGEGGDSSSQVISPAKDFALV